MEGERHDTKRQGEADGERSAEKAMVEGRDGRTKEGRGGRAARTDREQTAPAGHFETFAKNASYMGGLREGWIEKHSNKEEATGGTGSLGRRGRKAPRRAARRRRRHATGGPNRIIRDTHRGQPRATSGTSRGSRRRGNSVH